MRANRFSMHLSVDVANLEALLVGREGASALMLDLRYSLKSIYQTRGKIRKLHKGWGACLALTIQRAAIFVANESRVESSGG